MTHLDSTGKSWFDSLLSWEELEGLLQQLDEAERSDAVHTMMATFDYAVTQTVLIHLHRDHHLEFLELCHQGFHEPTVLIWLESRSQGITEHVRVTISNTHQELSAAITRSTQ